jgi:hypothetical protein
MDEARMVAQQISVRLTNGTPIGDEVTRRDLELLRHCEGLAQRFGVTLSVQAAASRSEATAECRRTKGRENRRDGLCSRQAAL